MGVCSLCVFCNIDTSDRSRDAEVHVGRQYGYDDSCAPLFGIGSIFFNWNTLCVHLVGNDIGLDNVQRLFVYIKCSNQ